MFEVAEPSRCTPKLMQRLFQKSGVPSMKQPWAFRTHSVGSGAPSQASPYEGSVSHALVRQNAHASPDATSIPPAAKTATTRFRALIAVVLQCARGGGSVARKDRT